MKAEHSLSQLCAALDVTRSGPGYDTILFAGGFLSPQSGMFLDPMPFGIEIGDAFTPNPEIIAILTSLGAEVWDEAEITEALSNFNIQRIYVLQQRAMQRTVIRLRELQLAVDITDQSTGAQMRIRTAIAEIHAEITVFRETALKIAQYEGHGWGTRAGRLLSGAGRFASIFSIASSAYSIWEAAGPYINDLQQRCDNNADTAADLAIAMGNLDAERADSFMVLNLWLIYWDQLSEFDGYDSQCY